MAAKRTQPLLIWARCTNTATAGAESRLPSHIQANNNIWLRTFVYSFSKLPKKTTPLYTYKKRKALADAVRELEQEQAQVNTHPTPYTESAQTDSSQGKDRNTLFVIGSAAKLSYNGCVQKLFRPSYFHCDQLFLNCQNPNRSSLFLENYPVKIKNNLIRQQLYLPHTRTYHNMCNPNKRSMFNGKFVWMDYKSYKP